MDAESINEYFESSGEPQIPGVMPRNGGKPVYRARNGQLSVNWRLRTKDKYLNCTVGPDAYENILSMRQTVAQSYAAPVAETSQDGRKRWVIALSSSFSDEAVTRFGGTYFSKNKWWSNSGITIQCVR